MDHPEGAGSERGDRVGFDPRVRLEFRGTQLSSDGGLLVMRELDDALGLSGLASSALCDSRRGKNAVHQLDGLFRQSVYGGLAGCASITSAAPPRRISRRESMPSVGRACHANGSATTQGYRVWNPWAKYENIS